VSESRALYFEISEHASFQAEANLFVIICDICVLTCSDSLSGRLETPIFPALLKRMYYVDLHKMDKCTSEKHAWHALREMLSRNMTSALFSCLLVHLAENRKSKGKVGDMIHGHVWESRQILNCLLVLYSICQTSHMYLDFVARLTQHVMTMPTPPHVFVGFCLGRWSSIYNHFTP
jgi:hypothetical protein